MNFFKLYIGDYQRDTAHLSITEHGAYMLMLQHYYATEKPLPCGKALHRMLRAQDKAERNAIDSVAYQFWRETDDGLVNDRADAEITKAAGQAQTNRSIAQAREAKRKSAREQHEPSTNRATNDEPSHSHSQTPEEKIQGAQHSTVERALAVLRESGFPKAGPDPRLLALIAQGATPEELGNIAMDARGKSNPWAWFLAAVEGRRADASRIALAPKVEEPWHDTRQGIVAKGVELGIGEWTEPDWHAGRMPQWPVYQARVFEAAGYQPPRTS